MRPVYREKTRENGHSLANAPRATIHQGRLSWALWLIPIAAALICVWFAYRDFISAGPLITLYFQDAEGLENQNTMLLYRGTEVGEVKSIALMPDTKSVKVTARLSGSAKALARVGSQFWIVRPQLKVGSISGLRTIISGDYIAVLPGHGPPTNVFVADEKEPLPVQPNALQLVLISPTLGSLQEGSPIFYRGVQVGQVDYFQLESDSRQVIFHCRVWEQYAPLVRVDSKFWNAGGLDMHLGIFKGVQITAESPKTIVSGGLEFATPPNPGARASNGTSYFVNEKPEDKWKTWAPDIDLHLPPEASSYTNGSASAIGSLTQ